METEFQKAMQVIMDYLKQAESTVNLAPFAETEAPEDSIPPSASIEIFSDGSSRFIMRNVHPYVALDVYGSTSELNSELWWKKNMVVRTDLTKEEILDKYSKGQNKI